MEPLTDLPAPPRDEAGAAIVVPQEIVPEAEPVFGVVRIAREQGVDEAGPLIGRGILQEGRDLLGGGQQADQVELGAAEEGAIAGGRGPGQVMLREVGIDEAIHGMIAARDGRGQRDGAWFERRLVGRGFEGEAGFPR